MSALGTALAVVASGAGLVMLAAEDPKRRRVHGLTAVKPRRRAAALMLLAAPGLGLALLGNAAGFTIWLGAATVAGWAVAATPPARAEAMSDALRGGLASALTRAGRLGAALRARREDGTAARIAALEARVAALEAERSGAPRPAPRPKPVLRAEVDFEPARRA